MKVPPLLVLVILVAIAIAASAEAPRADPPNVEIRMTPEAAAQCEAEGGCNVVSRAYMQQLLDHARALSCRSWKET